MRFHEFDAEADTAGAWVRFQAALGDAVDRLVEGEALEVEVVTGVNDLAGYAPFVQIVREEGHLRGHVASNCYLDRRFALDDAQEEALAAAGWRLPDDEIDTFTVLVEGSQVDRLAVQTVAALREVIGVPHPAFLTSADVASATAPSEPVAPRLREPDGAQVLHPRSSGELQDMVDTTVADFLGTEHLHHDQDGDIPIDAGGLTLYVSVSDALPVVEVWCRAVTGVGDLDRLTLELDRLNRTHPSAKLYRDADGAVICHQLGAAPFVPLQLRHVLAGMLHSVGELARELSARVGGRLTAFETPASPQHPTTPAPRLPQGLATLVELLHDRAVSTLTVATVMNDDRTAITDALVAVRRGHVDCGDVDAEVVLTHLRRALHRLVGAEVAGRRAGRPAKPSQQLSLMSEVEGTLDDGTWGSEAS